MCPLEFWNETSLQQVCQVIEETRILDSLWTFRERISVKEIKYECWFYVDNNQQSTTIYNDINDNWIDKKYRNLIIQRFLIEWEW